MHYKAIWGKKRTLSRSKNRHCPDPTERGANDINHANADIKTTYLIGLEPLGSLMCTSSADDLRPLMT